jgi:hypothetical protein
MSMRAYRRTSPIGYLIGVHLTGVHFLYACLSYRPSHLVSHRRASPINHLIGVSLTRAASQACILQGMHPIDDHLIGVSLIDVPLIGGHLIDASASHRDHPIGVSLTGASLIDMLLTGAIS